MPKAIILFAVIFFSSVLVFPQRAEALDPSLQITDEKLIGTTANILSLSFSLANSSANAKTVSYSLDYQPQSGNESFTQVVAQGVTVPALGTVVLQNTVPTPHFLIGEYAVFIRVESSSGALLAKSASMQLVLQSYTNVSFASCTANSINLKTVGSLSLKGNTALPPINCVVQSVSNVDANPQTYSVRSFVNANSLSGTEVGHSGSVDVTLTGNEQREVSLPSYIGSLPSGAYVLSIEIRDKKSELASNPVVASLNVGTIKVLSSQSDKNSYAAGQTALVSVDLSGYDATQNLLAQVVLSDAQGVCGTSAPTALNAAHGTLVKVIMTRDCSNYEITTSVTTSGGTVLDKYVGQTGTGAKNTPTPQPNSHWMEKIILLILAFLAIVGLAWYLFRRHQRSQEYDQV